MASDPPFHTLGALRSLAERATRPEVWSYIEGGAGEERTVAANLGAFRRRTLRPRVLRGVKTVDLRCRILSSEVRVPWYVSPMAYQGDIAPEGECATAAAASATGCLGVYSTLSTRSIEDIAAAGSGGPRWFQLYLQPEWADSLGLVRRAEASGYSAVVLTVDVPVFAVRDRQRQSGFAVESIRPLGNGPTVVAPARGPVTPGPPYTTRADSAVDWGVVERLRRATTLPIVVKGILRADDAREAVEHGAAGVVVSNHGGRQLDGAIPAIDALAEVVGAVGDRVPVLVDGGVRRGPDILIALALGATAVGVGRPILWSLALGGDTGVRRYLQLLEEEVVNAMILVGASRPGDLGADLLTPEVT